MSKLFAQSWKVLLGITAATALATATLADDGSDLIQVEINKGRMVKLSRPASSIVVADPVTADVQVVSPRLVFVHGKKVGETSITAVDSQDNTIFNSTVQVTHNLSSLTRAVKAAAPDADVGFKTVDGGLVMDGFANSVEESEHIRNIASAFVGDADKMVNMVTTGGSDQVMLQVKIVEMNRTDVKSFGINLQNAFSINGLSLQVLQGKDIEIDTGNALNGSVTEVDRTGLLDRSGSKYTGLLGRWHGGKMTSMIDALESQGLASVLAEPSLTTTSGKSANFLAGGEFPIPVRDGQGNISIQYKPFGVKLDFTPVVMSKDRVSITVSPEVSSINFDNPIEVSGLKNPIILSRKAQATVELGSGDTFMLAGLLKNDGSNNIDKFPGLGDLPVLGTMFRSQQFRNDKTELVILVTPYLVRPVAERKKMLTPESGYVPPTDFQRLLLGNLYQQEPLVEEGEEKTPAQSVPAEAAVGEGDQAPKLHGDGGFILE
jgi:pilus assembly protein CpaC